MNRKAATFVLFVNSLIFALAFHNDTDNDEILRKVGKNEHEFIAINMNKQILKNTTHPQANIGEQKWISQLFLEAERKFDMDEHVNKRCKTDYELYKLHLRNQSVWAVRNPCSLNLPSVRVKFILSSSVKELNAKYVRAVNTNFSYPTKQKLEAVFKSQ
ncbi:hypothetical protein PGB90_004123 [Kerria lacca]